MAKIIMLLGFLFFLGCQTLQRNPSSNNPTDSNFKKIIQEFEKSGGSGLWLNVNSPYSQENYISKSYYQIKSLPKEVNEKSGIYMLRLKNNHQLLQKMLNDHVPIIIGTIDLSTGISAMTFTKSDPFSMDVTDKLKIKNSTSIMLIQPTANKYEVFHEYRHWLDQQNPSYGNSVMAALDSAYEKNLISQDDASLIYRMISEIRGYSVQLQELRTDKKAKNPVVESTGAIINNKNLKKLESWYNSEELDVENRFMQGPYRSDFHNATIELRKRKNKALYSKMIADLEKFVFANDPKNKLTLRKLGFSPK